MNLELLEEIGLTKSEIKVYLALLELGSSTTGPIVDKSKIASSKIYEILEKLIQKGLASTIVQSGTKHFEAANPERLQDYMKEKEAKIKQQEQELSKILPELKLKQTLSKHKSETIVFKGIKGADTAFNDILTTLKKGEEVVAIGFSDVHKQFQDFLIKFHRKRSKKGIKARKVFGESLREMGEKIDKMPYSQVKFFPTQEGNPVATLVYADKTLLSLAWDDLWIQIKNKRLADANRARFEELWKKETAIVKGFKAMSKALNNFVDSIDKNDTFNALGATFGPKGNKQEFADVFKKYHEHRIKRGIKAQLLFQPSAKKTYEENKKNYGLCDVRFLPYDTDSPVSIHPYKDKTMMIIQKKDPTVITIHNKEITQSFLKHFEVMWNQETRIVKGLDAIQDLFEEMLEVGHADLIGARGYFMDARRDWVNKVWKPKAIKKGFTMRNIVDPETKGHYITKLPFAETKYTIPREFSSLSVFWIVGGKIAISNWVDKEPVVTIIENKNFYKTYKKQFETLWNKKIKF